MTKKNTDNSHSTKLLPSQMYGRCSNAANTHFFKCFNPHTIDGSKHRCRQCAEGPTRVRFCLSQGSRNLGISCSFPLCCSPNRCLAWDEGYLAKFCRNRFPRYLCNYIVISTVLQVLFLRRGTSPKGSYLHKKSFMHNRAPPFTESDVSLSL